MLSDRGHRVFDRGRPNGATSHKIRAHHEVLTRENEKLARQLNRRMKQVQGHPSEKRVVVVEEEQPPMREASQISEPDHSYISLSR